MNNKEKQMILKKSIEIVNRQLNPYHQVDQSPWPFLMSFALFCFGICIINYQVFKTQEFFLLSFANVCHVLTLWQRDVLREAMGGFHTIKVRRGIQIGFLLFQISELVLFSGLFWTYFHSALAPSIEQGLSWPPLGINPVKPGGLPLSNTVYLVASGFILSLAHHAVTLGVKVQTGKNLAITVLVGLIFVYLQGKEYKYGEFTITDSVYGSVFYMTTGLHGVHVMIGLLGLIIKTIRSLIDSYTTDHHQGLEFSVLYWHLVDIVWIYVYGTYYWWGSM